MQPTIVDVLGEIFDFLQTVDPTVFVAHCIPFLKTRIACAALAMTLRGTRHILISAYIMLPLLRMLFSRETQTFFE